MTGSFQIFWAAVAQNRGRAIGNVTKQWVIPEAYPVIGVIAAGLTQHYVFLFSSSSFVAPVAIISSDSLPIVRNGPCWLVHGVFFFHEPVLYARQAQASVRRCG